MEPKSPVVPADVAEWMGMDVAMLDFAIDLGLTNTEYARDDEVLIA